ncbi:hypothetical protein [Tenacibaculum sp. 190524A02b]|uniref:hypothetical protein n=1 Tax=Tenacibaculum vairaonense TaxID=3137860 RepID=UPI0031FA8388
MRKIVLLTVAIVVIVACEAVFVEDISNRYIKITAPADNASVKEGSVTFLWEALAEADSYQLQIATPTFANAAQILTDTLVAKNTYNQKLTLGEYEWRIKGKNSEYETSYTTHKLSITNTDIGNAETELLLPLDSEISNKTDHNLTWTKVTDATEYRVQIWQPDDQGTIVKDVIVKETAYTHTFGEGDFTWKVRPQSDTQNGKFTARKITVDSKVPNKPVNTSPENNATQTENTIDFTWTRTDVAGTEEIDSIYVFNDVNLTQLNFKDKGTNKTFKKESLEKNTYYWYVQSFDKANNKSEKSNTFLITIN